MAVSSSDRPSQRSFHQKDSNYSIFVGNLSYATTDRELRSFFEKSCGDVDTVHVVLDKQTSQSRGFAFVRFHTLLAYENALTLNGTSLAGRNLKISANKAQPTPHATISVSNPICEQKTRVVHCKKSNYDVYIGRPSIWGNPFIIGRDGDKAERIGKYRVWIMNQPELIARAKNELRGRILGCWCKPEDCHGDILAEIADTD